MSFTITKSLSPKQVISDYGITTTLDSADFSLTFEATSILNLTKTLEDSVTTYSGTAIFEVTNTATSDTGTTSLQISYTGDSIDPFTEAETQLQASLTQATSATTTTATS
ncbi:hypothetical protein [Serratia sp. M24T3]|uniref:hypothetical protein n=1 Tax=Serratia sp. M24T3 TaxID=932213 RepID=UPI00025B9F60|nr:hypothetical protein [Serratia sp. M24T3]EIC83956.1 hypothetical protein SPM24T3_13605 [Serratia sp. M24T3]